jgi:hypothetical protein
MNADSTPRITSLSPAQTARILSAAGQRRLDEALIEADIKAGAPTNADGTINLVHYVAWMARQVADPRPETGGEP